MNSLGLLRALATKNNDKNLAAENARIAAEEEKLATETAEREKAEAEEEETMRNANKKITADKEKKAMRKAKNLLRKLAVKALEMTEEGGHEFKWKGGIEEMEEEVEFLLKKIELGEIIGLCEALGNVEEKLDLSALKTLRGCYADVKSGAESAFLKAEKVKTEKRNEAAQKVLLGKLAKTPEPWSKPELAALVKAVKKYPAGGANRWEVIAQFINTLLCLPEPRSKDDCIKQYESVKESSGKPPATVKASEAEANNKMQVEEKKEEAKVEETKEEVPDETGWTATQTKDLQEALTVFNKEMEKQARWQKIGEFVVGKTKQECAAKYKEIRANIKAGGSGAVIAVEDKPHSPKVLKGKKGKKK